MLTRVSRMRNSASRQTGSSIGSPAGDADGRSSPHVTSNGSSALSPPTTTDSSSLHPHGVNGTANISLPHGGTSSFSYSSILTSAQSNQSTTEPASGNNTTNHDKPFKYSRDDMLNIWKNNAQKIKSNGIPLEFEKHEIFTSEETLDPLLLSDLSPAEREVPLCPILC